MKPIDCVNLTVSEIDNHKVAAEKELLNAQDDLTKAEVEDLELAKQIVLIQLKRKDLQIVIAKGKQNVRRLALDVRIWIKEFFAAKDNR